MLGVQRGIFLRLSWPIFSQGWRYPEGGSQAAVTFGSLGSTDCAAPDILLYCQLTTATIVWWYTDPSVMAVSPNEV